MLKGATKTRVHVTAALAALWLTACGGGGGDDPAAPPVGQGPSAPAPAPGAPAPAPGAPAPAPATGLSWSATGPEDVWHSLSSSDDGQVMVAGQAQAGNFDESALSVSSDGGQTWSNVASVGPGIWIASDVSGDGNRIVAVTLGGSMVMSNDRGVSFSSVALPGGATPAFEGVTLSQDGSRIAAASMDGPVFVGTVAGDGTVTWGAPTGLPASASWRAIDSSADGQVMVAVAQGPSAGNPAAAPAVYISTNGGQAWAPLVVAVGSPATPVTNQNWYRVKVSGDGNTIVLAANAYAGGSGDGIYVSKDRGQTFVRAHELVADYSSIAMSFDGGVIAVTHSTNPPATANGAVLLSTNGGTTFSPMTVSVDGTPVTEINWRAITMASDATRMAVAAGRFGDSSAGRIYVSSGSRPQ